MIRAGGEKRTCSIERGKVQCSASFRTGISAGARTPKSLPGYSVGMRYARARTRRKQKELAGWPMLKKRPHVRACGATGCENGEPAAMS